MKTTYKKHLLLSASCLALGFFSIPNANAASTCPGAQPNPVECPGTESRVVRCRDFKGNIVADRYCALVGMKPGGSRACTAACPANITPTDTWQGDGDGNGDGDPLVFDMDGNGISLLSCADGVMFDIDNDGELDQTGWTDGRDGLLSVDENGNGKIDNQSELFGTPDDPAYQHLANNDSNGDGKIDSDDNIWPHLEMWIDRNTNGKTDRGELKSMSDIGMKSIDINYDTVDRISNENRITAQGTFTRVLRGGRRVVADVAEAFLDFFSGG